MAGYLVLAYFVRYALTDWFARTSQQFWIVAIFDSVTFAGSSLVLWGMFNPEILTLLGTTKPFLAVAAVVGLLYSLRALFPHDFP
jgi:hypothetical protein